jgi:glutaconate CoA-transferase subunit B
MTDATLADLVIFAAAQAWRHDPEILASGITPLPRLAASLAKTYYNPGLLITDSECWFVEDPVPPGPRVRPVQVEGWAPYARTFDILWSGKRHAMVVPVQLDRFGQANISVIGPHDKPKVQMLGARGFPGNSVHHANSFFLPAHNKRVLMAGEVDFVCMAGYNPARWRGGVKPAGLDLRVIVTNLCVMDFQGPENAIRVVSLHPGVTFEQVQENTGFALAREGDVLPVTEGPDDDALAEIARLDPNNVRATVFKA